MKTLISFLFFALILTACDEKDEPKKAAGDLTPEQKKLEEVIGTYSGHIVSYKAGLIYNTNIPSIVTITETTLSHGYQYNDVMFKETGDYTFAFIKVRFH
jgi:hypothetical protein